MSGTCEHAGALRPVAAASDRCEACAAIGAQVVALRVCLTCGHVGCCEDSPHAHALRHHRETGHPMIASYGGRPWAWCYPHARYVDVAVPLPAPRSRLARWWRRLARRA